MHFDPGITIVGEIDRFGFDARFVGEDSAHDRLSARYVQHRFAVDGSPGAVDACNLDQWQLQCSRRFLQRLTARAAIIDLIVQLLDLAGSTLEGEPILDLVAHVRQRFLLARLDLGNPKEDDCKTALDDRRNTILGNVEGSLGYLWIDQTALGHQPQIDVGVLGAGFFRDIGKRFAASYRCGCGLSFGLVGKRDLLHPALLWRVETLRILLVCRLDIGIADRDVLFHGIDGQGHDCRRTQFLRHERSLVLLIRGL